MFRAKAISASSRLSAIALLGTWLLVVGLEFVHQVGHIVSGCSHHDHHAEHVHHHEGCSTWLGPHEETHFVQHEHVCDLCDWMFSFEVPPLIWEAPETLQEWSGVRGVGEATPGHARHAFWMTTGRRGPPQRG